MPRLYTCPTCGTPSPRPGLCEFHRARAQALKQHKDRARGYGSPHWQQVRRQVLARDGRCMRCGSLEDLTVHLDPGLKGNHAIAESRDALTLCRSCHGSLDAPRSSNGELV